MIFATKCNNIYTSKRNRYGKSSLKRVAHYSTGFSSPRLRENKRTKNLGEQKLAHKSLIASADNP